LILNAFTVDLEDWFCVGNMEGVFPPSSWRELELRLENPVALLLELLKKHGARATFFVLGWIAERCPEVVRKISDAGHEIGLHGYEHRRVTSMDRDTFEADLSKALDALLAAGVPRDKICGYRAPSFSIVEKTAWALDVIASIGLKYDSSIMPVAGHPDYGWPRGRAPWTHYWHDKKNAPWTPYCQGIIEVPMTPGLGGGYFRLFPYMITKYIVKRANRRGRAAVFYVHPWELDPEQPRISLPLTKRFRHYVNLDKTAPRLERLLSDFRFGAIEEVLSANGF
jgi:polysaccharide deacetylase family protein (PEP-CTERM system associated)